MLTFAAKQPISYQDFRLGMTFADVRALLKLEQDTAYASGQYMFVSRGTVLGRMHQWKQEAYNHYLNEFYREQEAA